MSKRGDTRVEKTRPNAIGRVKQRRFIAELAMTCNVSAACRAIGAHHSSIYALRERDADFAAQWRQALEQGYLHLEGELLRHARGSGVRASELASDAGDATDEPALPFNPELALKLLELRRRGDAQGRRSPVRFRQPTRQEVLAALDRKLTAMEKNLRQKAAGAQS